MNKRMKYESQFGVWENADFTDKYEVAPRSEKGIDWGVEGITIMRNHNARLVWRRGCMYFGGIGQRNYAPAGLEVLFDRRDAPMKPPHTSYISLTDHHLKRLHGEEVPRSRLSRKMLHGLREKIDAIFGEGAEYAAEIAVIKRGTVIQRKEGL